MIPDEATFLLSFPCAESAPRSSEVESDGNNLAVIGEHGTTAATSTVPYSDGFKLLTFLLYINLSQTPASSTVPFCDGFKLL